MPYLRPNLTHRLSFYCALPSRIHRHFSSQAARTWCEHIFPSSSIISECVKIPSLEKFDRKVALKILAQEFGEDKDRMSRFVREAKSASALNHPNTITIYEIGETDSTHFIATEFIEGETLHSRFQRICSSNQR